jgi:hypothetical protein
MGDPCEPYGTCDQEDKRFKDNTTNSDANKFCPGKNPFVSFAGYTWWTNFHWSKEYGPYVYGDGGTYSTVFDPCLVSVVDNLLILRIGPPQNWNGTCPPGPNENNQFDYTAWRTSEVCTVDKLGYGRYIVTARCAPGNWSTLDKQAVFGVFTYQYYGEDPNVEPNCHRELDALEVMHDLNHDDGNNAQFTIQPYQEIKPDGKAMHRFKIPPTPDGWVTIVMDWYWDDTAKKNVVEYYLYYGDFNKDNLPVDKDKHPVKWNEHWSPNDDGLDKYVPKPACQRFHMNLWLWFGKPPATTDLSVLVKRFQFVAR